MTKKHEKNRVAWKARGEFQARVSKSIKSYYLRETMVSRKQKLK